MQWIVHRNKKSQLCMELDIRLSIILENEFGRKRGKSRFNARRVRHA